MCVCNTRTQQEVVQEFTSCCILVGMQQVVVNKHSLLWGLSNRAFALAASNRINTQKIATNSQKQHTLALTNGQSSQAFVQQLAHTVELLFILKPIKYSLFFLSLSFCLPCSLPQLRAKNNGVDLTSERKTSRSTPLQLILRYFASISPNFFIYLMIRVKFCCIVVMGMIPGCVFVIKT